MLALSLCGKTVLISAYSHTVVDEVIFTDTSRLGLSMPTGMDILIFKIF